MRWKIFSLAAFVTITLVGNTSGARVDYDLGVYSKYVWRGITVTDGPVFQPSVTTIHNSGFAFNVWGNIDLDDANGYKGEINEIDLALYLERGEAITWSVGVVEYVYPNTIFPDTRELFVSVGSELLVSSSVTVNYDFGDINDFYAMLSLGHTVEFGEEWSSTLGVSAGFAGSDFAESYSGGSRSGLHDGNAVLSVDFSRPSVTTSLLVGYTATLDEDVLTKQLADFWAGIHVILSF